MDSKRWSRIQQIFEQALQQPPEQQDAFLESACHDDPALADEEQEKMKKLFEKIK